jgi:hypothetical protein
MNARIRELMKIIEGRGGKLHLSDSLPDEVTELFLREVVECPDCQAEARRKDAGLTAGQFEDQLPIELAWTARRLSPRGMRRKRGH